MDKSKVLVMLDNGHGKNTSGKRSPLLTESLQKKYGTDRLYEYAYTREIVKIIQEQLQKDGYNVYIVTPEITDITLGARVRRINNKHAEMKKLGKTSIMCSVHLNAAGNGQWMNAKGWSAYTTVGQNNSDKFATKLYEAAHKILEPLNQKIRIDKRDGDEDYESNFYIIKNANCPAVLTESMFMDNKEEAEWLLSDEGKNAIAMIHVNGIKSYISTM